MSSALKNRYHTVSEVAETIGVTPGRVRQIVSQSDGNIGEKFGRDWHLTHADIKMIRKVIRIQDK